MKSALVVCFTDLKRDTRVRRQIDFLQSEYRVTAIALDAPADITYTFVKAQKTRLTFSRKLISSFFLLAGFNRVAYRLLHNHRQHIPALKKQNFDLIVANDIEALPFAFDVAGPNSKIFFDAHEYAPRQFEDRLYWRIFFKRFNYALCRRYIPKVNGMSTVGQGIAREYQKHFGIKPIVITNAPAATHNIPLPAPQEPIRLVHHGIFNVSRHPEAMIDMMRQLDERFTLDLFFLLSNNTQKHLEHYEQFKRQAEATGRIRVLPTLESNKIIGTLHAGYDIGIILIPPVNFNYRNALPNKLFDCIEARIGLAVGPLKEIADIVQQYDIGVVSNDFTGQALADVISRLSLADVNRFKQNTQKAAAELNAEHNKTLFLEALQKLF